MEDNEKTIKRLLNTLRTIRAMKGLSQEAVAQDIGISAAAYSKLERGESNLSLGRLSQILHAMSITVYDFLSTDVLIEQGPDFMQVAEYSNFTSPSSSHHLSEEVVRLREEKMRLESIIHAKDALLNLYMEAEKQN